jgi:glycosyltransferase involved in cell wall biosynthesis
VPTLHQFVPTLEPGATGSHAIEIQRFLRTKGWRSELFSYEAKPPFEEIGFDYRDYGEEVPAQPDDLLLYHVAIGSVVADWLMPRHETLLLYFHNLTPAEYYDRWEPFAAYACTWGRTQLRRLVDRATFAMAASAYSQRDLLDAGYVDTAVVPILLDTAQFEADVDHETLQRLTAAKAAGGTRWLFVGRLSPNKTQEDVIKAFAVYRRVYDPRAHLALLGSDRDSTYGRALRRFASELGLADAVDIPGGVPDPVKSAYLRTADVFVYLSEHEGFGVPILEAWYHGLPVVAYAAGALPEIAGDGALMLNDKSPTTVAAAVHHLLSDETIRTHLAANSAARLEQFSLERARSRFLEVVALVQSRL